MVRPNQIISSDVEKGELTFIMFARSEKAVKRRVLFINFPSTIMKVIRGDQTVDDYVTNVRQVTEGMVNRYAVTLNTSKIVG